MLFPFPLIAQTTPIPMGIPWESYGNGNFHSHAHLYSMVVMHAYSKLR